jgi:hypothetical protein
MHREIETALKCAAKMFLQYIDERNECFFVLNLRTFFVRFD